MIKFLLRVATLALLLCTPVFAKDKPAPDIRETLVHSTLAVYEGKQICKWASSDDWLFGTMWDWGCEFKTRFLCTATVIVRESETEYVGLTAGHCFDYGEHEYYIAEGMSEHPVVHKIALKKFENDDRYDFAIFTFNSHTDYTPIGVSLHDTELVLGSKVLNVNFAMGIAKQAVEGPITAGIVGDTTSRMKPLAGRFLVAIGLGPGASGSAIVDEKTGKIIGLVEAIFPATQMPTVVMPTGKALYNFLEDDSAGLKPQAPQGKPPEPPVVPEETLWHHIVRAIQQWFAEHF